MSVIQKLDGLSIDSEFRIDAWTPFQNGLFTEKIPDSAFVYYSQRDSVGEWPPSIVSYHGHHIPYPDVIVEYISRERKFWRCMVTFVRRRFIFKLGKAETHIVAKVRAWQGDNNIIHLIEELKGEDSLNLDMSALSVTPDEIDLDYYERIIAAYPDALDRLHELI